MECARKCEALVIKSLGVSASSAMPGNSRSEAARSSCVNWFKAIDGQRARIHQCREAFHGISKGLMVLNFFFFLMQTILRMESQILWRGQIKITMGKIFPRLPPKRLIFF